MRIERKRLWGAVAAAAALHGLTLFVVSRNDAERPRVVRAPGGEPSEIELVEWKERLTASERNRPGEAQTTPRAATTRSPLGSLTPAPIDSAGEALLLPEVAISEEDEPSTTEQATRPRLSLAQAGYTEPNPWALPGVPVATATEQSERRLERNLAESAMRLDYQRSVGIEGPVVLALNQKAWGHVPPNSRARISVTIDSDGRVSAIDVVEVNGGMASWREVSQSVVLSLDETKLRVPPGHGVELVFEVESKVLMPSGRKPQSGVSILGVPLGQEDSTREPVVKILTPHAGIDKLRFPKPGMPEEEIELPMLRVGVDLVSANPDPVDWGAASRQVVHTRLVRQRVL